MISGKEFQDQVGYFNFKDREKIPNSAGFYAWFLPLWMYSEDLNDLIKIVSEVFSYEVSCVDDPENFVNKDIDFNWSHLKLKIKHLKRTTKPIPFELVDSWSEVVSNEESKLAAQKAMMLASIYMPPLYVGKSDDLKGRYEQHISESTFKVRFESNIKKLGITLSVHDLLFSCILIDSDVAKELRKYKLNELIEKAIMRMSNPPYSKQ